MAAVHRMGGRARKAQKKVLGLILGLMEGRRDVHRIISRPSLDPGGCHPRVSHMLCRGLLLVSSRFPYIDLDAVSRVQARSCAVAAAVSCLSLAASLLPACS